MFVAAFIGSPSMNLYEAELTLNGDAFPGKIKIGSNSIALAPESLAARPALRNYDGQRVVVGVRPEDIEDAAIATTAPAERRMPATVKLVEALGSELMVHLSIDASTVNSGDPDMQKEEHPIEGLANAVARFSPRSKVELDEATEVVVVHRQAPLLRSPHTRRDLGMT